MHHDSAPLRARPDHAADFREVGRRLDVLRDLPDPTPDQRAELMRLWLAWAHLQPTPAPRRPRRLGTPAKLPDE